MLTAGLSHDVVENTSRSLYDVWRELGGDVAFLVDSVTKINGDEAATQRKLRRYAFFDNRAPALKMADRITAFDKPLPKMARNKAFWNSTNYYIELGREFGHNEMALNLEKLNNGLFVEGLR